MITWQIKHFNGEMRSFIFMCLVTFFVEYTYMVANFPVLAFRQVCFQRPSITHDVCYISVYNVDKAVLKYSGGRGDRY